MKHENVYIRHYETPMDLSLGLASFFNWYNNGRIHSSLEYFTPKSIYFGENVLTK